MSITPVQTFDNFRPEPGTEKCVKALKGIIAGDKKLCLIYGGVGNGKTHLLKATAEELKNRGQFVRVINFVQILTTLTTAIHNPGMDYDMVLDRYCNAERLIIDDIGAGEKTGSDFSARILEAIVVHRYGRELLTVMATNKAIESLPERVVSRFKDNILSYLVMNKAADYRPKR